MFLSAIIPVLSASSASSQSSATSSSGNAPFTIGDFLNKLLPNGFGPGFVIQLVAFVILIIIVFFLGYKPVKKLLDARKEYVNSNLRGSEDAKLIAERNAKETEENIAKSKEEATRIVENAKKEATKAYDDIIAQAKEDAASIKKQADLDIADAVKKSEQEVHDKIVDLSLAASSQLLGREVNTEDNNKLVDEFVKDLEEK